MNRLEFCNVWKSIKKVGNKEIEVPMSLSTFNRRRSWAQENYPDWQKVFLASGRVDLKEYQKFETFRSEKVDGRKKIITDNEGHPITEDGEIIKGVIAKEKTEVTIKTTK